MESVTTTHTRSGLGTSAGIASIKYGYKGYVVTTALGRCARISRSSHA